MDPTVSGNWPQPFPGDRPCDRGISSPKLWKQIRAQGAPLSYRHLRVLTAANHCPRDAWRSRHGLDRTGHRRHPQGPTPLHTCWWSGTPSRRNPGILTDLPPEAVGVSWYALRLDRTGLSPPGRPAIKSIWKWDKTRRTDPTRVCHWLVLSVATLLALALTAGSPQATCGRRPSRLLPSSQQLAEAETVFRRGIDWLRRLMHKGRLEPGRLPEPWPKHKPNLHLPRAPLKTLYIPLSGGGGGTWGVLV